MSDIFFIIIKQILIDCLNHLFTILVMEDIAVNFGSLGWRPVTTAIF